MPEFSIVVRIENLAILLLETAESVAYTRVDCCGRCTVSSAFDRQQLLFVCNIVQYRLFVSPRVLRDVCLNTLMYTYCCYDPFLVNTAPYKSLSETEQLFKIYLAVK